MVIINEAEYLAHYGTPRHSGRYPWGSSGWGDGEGGSFPRSADFLDYVGDMKRQGLTDSEICKGLGISTTQLRARVTIAKNEKTQSRIAMAERLKAKGMSNGAIAERMGLPGESSVRALLAPGVKERAAILTATSDMIKREVDAKRYVDIGSGVENYINVSKEKLNASVAILREQGYEVHTVPVTQLGTGLDTRTKVLALPGTTWGDVRKNQDKIQPLREFSNDGGHTYNKIKDPISINPERVKVSYKEDGGDEADGVIYIRPGVKDLSLGGSRYAQVRIKVGEDHYLKGMAVYKDGLPDGTDIVFNTNKTNTGNNFDAMKPFERDKDGNIDPDYPFTAIVTQILDKPGDPDAKPTSAINLVNEQGQWAEWNRNLSSQVLSKQTPTLAKTQLAVTYDRRKNEFDEIMALTNPTIKKKLLEEFAESTDSAAVHLKAAALPRQATHVILPLGSIKPTEIYAPGYNNGERVVLLRFPHGGTFEIPELTVNNKNREGTKVIGSDSKDAVGIHHKVAKRLSGADFDGDTVLVIPNKRGEIQTSPALEALKDFDPQMYKLPDDVPRINPRRKNQLMGDVSNLITDMTIKHASHEQLSRAIRHSMVVIDSEKHHLNHKLSAQVYGIKQLKEEYQGKPRGGASTLISRKKSYDYVPELKPRPMSEGGPVDKETGRRVFVETGRTKPGPDGTRVPRRMKVNKLARAEDAHTLSSGTPMEKHYADHSNKLKALANEARVAAQKTPRLKYSASANRTYAKQVASLKSQLTIAERNAPRERQAQVIANAVVRAKRAANPHLEDDTLKKIKFQAMEEARLRMGAKKQRVVINQQEWNAIQEGAISNNMLTQILRHADVDVVRNFATPRRENLMTNNSTQLAQQLLSVGYTRAEVASRLGVSLTTLDNATSGRDND